MQNYERKADIALHGNYRLSKRTRKQLVSVSREAPLRGNKSSQFVGTSGRFCRNDPLRLPLSH